LSMHLHSAGTKDNEMECETAKTFMQARVR